jgi:hypothetical protein
MNDKIIAVPKAWNDQEKCHCEFLRTNTSYETERCHSQACVSKQKL